MKTKQISSCGGFVRATITVPLEGPVTYRVERFRTLLGRNLGMGWKLACEGERPTEAEAVQAARFAVDRLAARA